MVQFEVGGVILRHNINDPLEVVSCEEFLDEVKEKQESEVAEKTGG